MPLGAILAAGTAVVLILWQVLVGFVIARMHGLAMPKISIIAAPTSFMSVPVVGLGIAWLVSILAHAVGLFLQQEDFPLVYRSGDSDKTADEASEEPEAKSPPALYPGYILALIAFAVSALAGVVCILVAGMLLLALIAYYRDLWKKPVLGPTVLAGSKVLAVLLGAAGGGWEGQVLAMPELFLACAALAAYTWATETTMDEWPRRGPGRWRLTMTVAVVGAAMLVAALRSSGVMTLGPWLVVWLAVWLTARTATLSVTMSKSAGPAVEQVISRQYQRGELLLLAVVTAALLPDWQGALAFAAVFVFFPIAALLEKR